MTRSRALLSPYLLIGVLLLCAGCPDATLGSTSDGGVDSKVDLAAPVCANQIVDGKLNVDIQAITLTGRITVNGVVPPAERFGTVTLRNSTTGDSVALGMLTDASYTPKQIIPGVYDVYYAWDTTDTVNPPALPRNQKALIRSGVTLTSTQTFNVDIPTVTLSGQITVNGVVPPAERFGTVTLRNSTTGDSVSLGTVTDASYTPKQIIPGVYDVFYSWDTTDTVNPPALPRNQKALIRSGVTLTSTQTFNVDIPTITLTGRITVNGVVPPAERFGTVTLRNSTTGDSVALGMLTDASYTPKQIIPGVYDVFYSWDTTDTVNPPALPRNQKALIRSGVTLTSSQTFNVDIQAITLTGRITVNGVVPPAERFGTVTLRNSTTGDSV
ncbi:MAG TPA: hypothetical protein PLY80_12195, partial [Pseudomonadota bacterium]|nr:hypothetical protein [Pseudomonadota bacterium]